MRPHENLEQELQGILTDNEIKYVANHVLCLDNNDGAHVDV